MSDITGRTTEPYDCLVIGAGPSGLMAAITAARQGAEVLVLEHRERPLKKLYATGNGRCNFTNLYMDEKVYRGSDPLFAYEALKVFGRTELLDFMHSLGLMTRSINGYVYPYNEQARAVADVILLECRRLGIRICCGEDVVNITHEEGVTPEDEVTPERNRTGALFSVSVKSRVYTSQNLILAAGGKASPTHGSDGSINKFVRAFGHNIILQQPALVPLMFGNRKLAAMAGVRIKCGVSLAVDTDVVSSERGEIIFNRDNISGIPVMQLSRFATEALAKGQDVSLFIDMFPDSGMDELTDMLKCAFKGQDAGSLKGPGHKDLRRDRTAVEALGLSINEKLAALCLDEAGIVQRSLASSCSDEKLKKLAELLKCMEVTIIADAGFDRAQVTSGGVDVSELTGDMESRLVPGLYIIGELCDIDGTCGGYNLQWAFSSGYIAGRHVAVRSEI